MSPRPYNLGKRQAQISAGRRQVLDAARGLLAEATSYRDFTVDAVARGAGVARATVYYQFGSKPGLLEAVCDDLAAAGGLADLADAFTEDDAEAAWQRFVAAFGRFWDVDRPVMRRLRALAQLDPEVADVIAARDQRRRQGIEVLLRRRLHDSVRTRRRARAIARRACSRSPASRPSTRLPGWSDPRRRSSPGDRGDDGGGASAAGRVFRERP